MTGGSRAGPSFCVSRDGRRPCPWSVARFRSPTTSISCWKSFRRRLGPPWNARRIWVNSWRSCSTWAGCRRRASPDRSSTSAARRRPARTSSTSPAAWAPSARRSEQHTSELHSPLPPPPPPPPAPGRRGARFPGSVVYLSGTPTTREDIKHVTSRVGAFGKDNRAGIERTLHRISAIRNRQGEVIGLTCRVGRAVFGTVDIVRDVIEQGKSILLLGRPGVGKTTLLREAARVLADEFKKRVVIVDTSNEIAGDGDIPHPGIGGARRMQVAVPDLQHAVMIEAVENHMPEVIVIDEIGTEAEALAARTIAERGVQLVATAHGNTLDNLLQNPTLADLIGGIQAVTLSDEEARRRGTQKNALKRKEPPTFDVIIEIQNKDRLAVHHDVASVVDRFLRGAAPRPELRVRTDEGEVQITQPPVKVETWAAEGD